MLSHRSARIRLIVGSAVAAAAATTAITAATAGASAAATIDAGVVDVTDLSVGYYRIGSRGSRRAGRRRAGPQPAAKILQGRLKAFEDIPVAAIIIDFGEGAPSV